MSWRGFVSRPLTYNPLPLLRLALISYITLFQLPGLILSLGWSAEIATEFAAPGSFIRLLHLPFPFPESWVEPFRGAMLALGFLAVIGFLTRFSTALFAFGYLYLSAVESAWGWHDHGPSLVSQVLIVLVFAPGADGWSVDRLLQWARRGRSDSLLVALAPKGLPRWGLQLILIVVSLFYFNSGFSKLRYGGPQWLNGRPLAFYLSGRSLSSRIQQFTGNSPPEAAWRDGFGLDVYLYGARPGELGQRLAENATLMRLGATGAVVGEILMPLILFGGWIRTIFLLLMAAFHFGVLLLMGIPFITWIVIDLALINWCGLLRFVRTNEAAGG